MFHRLVISVCIFVASCTLLSAAPLDPNVRDVAIGVTSGSNSMLNDFVSPIRGFFFSPGDTGKNGVIGAFTSIAFNINDIFNSRKFVTTYETSSTYQATMSRRDIRFYKLTLQLPLGKPDANFRKKERSLNKPDVDFSN